MRDATEASNNDEPELKNLLLEAIYIQTLSHLTVQHDLQRKER